VTHGERIVAALVALVSGIRIANGYLTEAGADTQDTPMFTPFGEDGRDEWHTLVYESIEELNGGAGSHGNGQTDVAVLPTYNIDVFWRGPNPGPAYQRVKHDLRKALQPGRIEDSAGTLGALTVYGPTLITDQLSAGIVGLRQPVSVQHWERVGDPDNITT